MSVRSTKRGARCDARCTTALAALVAPALVAPYAAWAAALTVVAALFRLGAQLRNARIAPAATPQSAIGVRHPRVVQRSQGAMGGSFNTREFFHGRSRTFFRSIKWVFLVLAFPLPAALLAAGLWRDAPRAARAGLRRPVRRPAGRALVFFFAQANHPQNLYYQAVA